MQKIKKIVHDYPLSLLCIVLIWILCFCTPPHTPLDGVPFIDKWTHFVMYGGTCGVVWIEYMRCHDWELRLRRLLLQAWLMPVMMSGLIELLQAYCTGGRRSGDWMDFLANSIGAILGCLAGYAVWAAVKHRRKS